MKMPITIAYVEDNPTLRLLLGIHLNREGFKIIHEANNGQELMEKLHNGSTLPDACLLDLNMPVMDGFETARMIRSMYPSIKILACSTDDFPHRVETILGSGAHGFVSKDVSPEEIQRGLLAILNNQPYIGQHPTTIKSCGGRKAEYPRP